MPISYTKPSLFSRLFGKLGKMCNGTLFRALARAKQEMQYSNTGACETHTSFISKKRGYAPLF